MADLDKNTFKGTYATVFADNTTNDIIAENMRDFTDDIADSFDQSKTATPSTAGATITLDFGDREKGIFTGSASFATAKAVAFSNDSNAISFQLAVEITDVAATLDFGSGSVFKSDHNDFAPGTQVFTFSFTGFILIKGTKVGSNWWLEVKGPFA